MGFWPAEQPPHTPKPPVSIDFEVRTTAELVRLVATARAARRSVAHRICADEAPCRHCAIIRDTHRLIDDHVTQIEIVRLDELAALDGTPLTTGTSDVGGS